jgi:hypothetical protein
MEKSKLIPQAQPHTDGPAPAPVEAPVLTTHIAVPVTKAVTIPLDVANAIQREAARDPSDPFLARRLAAHYRSGIWTPADARK